MPNWVINHINIKCNKTVFEQIKQFVAGDNGDFDFEKIIPMPNSVFRGDLGREEEERYPGELNWYDWSIKYWGTKWNCNNAYYGDSYFVFETAWSAPDPVIAKLAEKFPKVKITHRYADEDIGYNCGINVYENGKLKSHKDCSASFARKLWNE